MFQPVGSLSPSVYWRRRALVAVLLVAAVVLVWTLFTGGDGGRSGRPAAAGTHPAAATPTRTPATITPSPGTGGPPGVGGADPSADPSDGLAGDDGASGAGSGSGAGFGPAPTCPDSALHLTVTADRSTYRPGDRPVLRLTLTNTSTAICTRDVGAAQQEALVYAGPQPGQDQFWSSNDCNPGGDPDVRSIDVDQALHFSVTWPEVSSGPRCVGTPAPAGPGDYSVVARIGTLRSDPARITVNG
ncbi:MAG TPA: hypothetical protein VFX70_12660 [Mycobacteriales bacterium]|nr:hypothetical protein [Mycobacteriales bacterium]